MSRRYFGTDGIRGVAGQHPMTANFAFKLGVAVTEALKEEGKQQPLITIGMDTRRSGRMLAHAMSSAIMSRGANVIFLDIIPTPGVSYLTRTLKADAGVVISASHNPFDDNGIKFFNHEGKKLSDKVEHTIENWLDKDPDKLELVTGEVLGSSERYRSDRNDYIQFLESHAPSLKGLNIGLDCANGASYALAPRLFKELGAQIDVINAHPDGLNINKNCGSTHPEALALRVKNMSLDLGVSFDGDADRALLIDRKGRLVTGDHMMAICGIARNEKTVVATLMSNLGVERYLNDKGITMLRTQVGDRYVHEALEENGLSLGGEQSGHMLFLDKAPTGDGLMTALQTLAAIRESGKSLEDWMDEIPLYPQTLVNVRVSSELKAGLQNHPDVTKAVTNAEQELGEHGRINLRPSGTEPLIRVMVEGPEQNQIEAIAKSVAATVESASA